MNVRTRIDSWIFAYSTRIICVVFRLIDDSVLSNIRYPNMTRTSGDCWLRHPTLWPRLTFCISLPFSHPTLDIDRYTCGCCSYTYARVRFPDGFPARSLASVLAIVQEVIVWVAIAHTAWFTTRPSSFRGCILPFALVRRFITLTILRPRSHHRGLSLMHCCATRA